MRTDRRRCSGAGCGGALAKQCGSCGADLGADARFCDLCGTPVVPVRPEPGSPPAGDIRGPQDGDVLFGDLVGSTSFGERVDAETAREAMAATTRWPATVIEATAARSRSSSVTG